MKILVRQNCFETNSSSTHSLQIVDNKETPNLMELIYKDIINMYMSNKDDYESNNSFSSQNYFDENTFYIKGFELESSHEETCVYYIIKTWVAKIQYMAMFLGNYQYYLEGYDKDEYSKRSWSESKKDLLMKTPTYQTFIRLCLEYITNKRPDINSISWDLNDELSSYIDGLEDFRGFSIDVFNIKESDIITLFNYVMDDSFVLVYKDIAYSPYTRPLIYII